MYDKEYLFIDDYKVNLNSASYDRTPTVSNPSELKNAIIAIVKEGKEDSSILFADNYVGDISEDLANSCWQIQSQDALCVYCVDAITYKLSRFVTYYEAIISIEYSETAVPMSQIHKQKYSTGLEDLVYTAIKNHDRNLVLLVERSTYSSADIENLIHDTYCSDPIISPVRPKTAVSVYSGKNYQRLYDIEFKYGLDREEIVRRQAELNDLTLFTEEEINKSDYEKLISVFNHMKDITVGTNDSIYDSLVLRCSNSEGSSLAFVALCNAVGLESIFVSGLKDWNTYNWNIVKIDDNYYHVDMNNFSDQPFLMTDEQMWSTYRWDTTKYPECKNSFVQ